MVYAYKVHRWHEINKVATRTKLAGRITAQSLGNSRQLAITPETPLSRGRRRARSIELREYSIPVSRQITVATRRVFVFYGKFMGNVKQNCLFINSARRSIIRRKFVLFSDDCHYRLWTTWMETDCSWNMARVDRCVHRKFESGKLRGIYTIRKNTWCNTWCRQSNCHYVFEPLHLLRREKQHYQPPYSLSKARKNNIFIRKIDLIRAISNYKTVCISGNCEPSNPILNNFNQQVTDGYLTTFRSK